MYIYIKRKGMKSHTRQLYASPMRQEKVVRKKHTQSTQTLFTRNWPFYTLTLASVHDQKIDPEVFEHQRSTMDSLPL